MAFLKMSMFFAMSAQFQASPLPSGKATLVAETGSIRPGTTLDLGVYLQPSSGAHTYWINPGDSGGPTSISLNLPNKWKVEDIEFPPPDRINLSGVVSYGYDKPELVIIPIHIPSDVEPAKVKITANVKWLTCTSEICKPADQQVALVLGSDSRSSPQWSDRFRIAKSQLATRNVDLGARVQRTVDGFRLSFKTGSDKSTGDIYFYSAKSGVIDHSKSQSFVVRDGMAVVTLPKSPYSQRAPTELAGILSVNDKNSGKRSNYKIDLPIQP